MTILNISAPHQLLPYVSTVTSSCSGEAITANVFSLHDNFRQVEQSFLVAETVAVIGAGPGGLIAARWLIAYGFEVTIPRIRFDTRVDFVDRVNGGWLIQHSGVVEHFDRIVLASGRFHSPHLPHVPGLDSFTGTAGVTPTYRYRDHSRYLGKRVLVAGCAVSALEIAAELAQVGAERVVVTRRRQRYVLPKFAAGVPSDHRIFTRYGALANEVLASEEIERQLKEIVVEAEGSPEQYGAPVPDPSLFAAWVTLNQGCLVLVAEGRIGVRPWMRSVSGTSVIFDDGTCDEFDGIVMGTGFDLDLPFLSDEIRAILDLDTVHLDADRHTFHPDLPGLAFVGMWDQSGGYFVPLELQARWIAYTWGGVVSAPSEADQRASIAAYRSRRGMSQKTRMNLAAFTFAGAAAVEPQLANWPQLRRILLFGPLAPSSFRLEGPDALPDAEARLVRDAAAFGAITSNELTEREHKYWTMVLERQSGRPGPPEPDLGAGWSGGGPGAC